MMSSRQKFRVKITQLKISKPFLKIVARDIESSLKDLQALYDNAPTLNLVLGDICVAYVDEGKYERCRVMKLSGADNIVSVSFTDLGIHQNILRSRVRILQDEEMQKKAPLCKEYILGGLCIDTSPNAGCKGKVKKLHDEIINKNFELIVLGENEAGTFVDLRTRKDSLIHNYITKNPSLRSSFKVIILENQMAMMEERIRAFNKQFMEKQKPQTFVVSPEVSPVQLKTFTTDGRTIVRVTCYDDGPFGFYVQFKNKDDEYQQFQSELQKHKGDLVRLKSPSVGSKCIVKIFRMPIDVFKVPPFAKKFQLAGLADFSGHRRDELSFYFKHLTNNKLLKLEVVYETGLAPQCRLSVKNSNMLDEMKHYNPHTLKYLKSKPVHVENVYDIIVTSVESPKRFYVMQLDSPKYQDYDSMLSDLNELDPPKLNNPTVGDACLIKTGDVFVRNIILSPSTSKVFKCQNVDTGFVDEYHENEIKVIVNDFLKIPPMAIRCCLSGFESNTSKEATKTFNEICRRFGEFKMKVVNKMGDENFVELETKDGKKIAREMKFAGHEESDFILDRSNWSSQLNASSQSRKSSRQPSVLNETVNTLIESPSKNYEEWNEVESDHMNSTDIGDDDYDSRPDSGWGEPNPSFEFNHAETERNPPRESRQTEADQAKDHCDAGPSTRKDVPSSSSSSSGIGSEIFEVKVRGEPARITVVIKPTNFTIPSLKTVAKYETFMKKLQVLAEAQAPLTVFDVNSFCLAYNRLTETWCRAIILDVSKKDFFVSVRCVDDGNTFSIQEKTELRTSSVSLVFEKYFGIHCSLPVRYDTTREQEANDFLTSIRNNDLSYHEIAKYKNLQIIELFDNGKNITDILVKMGIATRQWITRSGHCYITFVASATKFSIQMEEDDSAVNQVIDFTSAYTQHKVKDPQIGMLVLALFKQDKCWYRAKIESLKKNGSKYEFEVYFIDHGHSDMVDVIGAIDDPTIANIPPFAIKCMFALRQNLNAFNDHAKKKLKELASFGKKKFVVEMLKPGDDAAEVNIYDGGENIVHTIMLDAPEKNPRS